LKKNAVSHTLLHGSTVAGNTTSIDIRVVLPSNFHPASVAGASSPTKLRIAMPSTQAGARGGSDRSGP
jgi:hypothetical protein